jgi:hypothetical protein
MGEYKWDEMQAGPSTAEALKYGRRLSDKILIAFHHACDIGALSTAEELLGTLTRVVGLSALNETPDRRKVSEALADANYRLWDLKRRQSPASAPEAVPNTE